METVAVDLTLAYRIIGATVLGASMGVLFQPYWPQSQAFGRVAWVLVLLGLSWLLYDTQGVLSGVVLAASMLVSTIGLRALQRRHERRDGEASQG